MNFRNVLALSSRFLFVYLLFLFSFTSQTCISAQSFRGAIRGEVADAQGLKIAAAKVIARNLGTSETREVTADEDGAYRFLELPAGEYEVSAVAPGFEEVRVPKVRVEVGRRHHGRSHALQGQRTSRTRRSHGKRPARGNFQHHAFSSRRSPTSPGITSQWPRFWQTRCPHAGCYRRRFWRGRLGKGFWPIQHQRQSRSFQQLQSRRHRQQRSFLQ